MMGLLSILGELHYMPTHICIFMIAVLAFSTAAGCGRDEAAAKKPAKAIEIVSNRSSKMLSPETSTKRFRIRKGATLLSRADGTGPTFLVSSESGYLAEMISDNDDAYGIRPNKECRARGRDPVPGFLLGFFVKKQDIQTRYGRRSYGEVCGEFMGTRDPIADQPGEGDLPIDLSPDYYLIKENADVFWPDGRLAGKTETQRRLVHPETQKNGLKCFTLGQSPGVSLCFGASDLKGYAQKR